MCKKDTVSFRSRPELRLSDDDQLADWRLPGHGGSGGSRKAQWVGWGRAPGGGGEGGGGDKGKRRGAEWQCAKDEEDSS